MLFKGLWDTRSSLFPTQEVTTYSYMPFHSDVLPFTGHTEGQTKEVMQLNLEYPNSKIMG